MLKKCKYLLLLIVGLFGFIGFSSAFEYYFSPHDDYVFLSGSSFMFVKPGSGNTNKIDFYPSPGNCEWFVKVDDTHTYCYRYGGTILSVDSSAKWMIWRGNYEIYCSDLSSCILDLESRDDIDVLSGMSNCPECDTCPTTGEILSGACDINYCVENDLCPISSGSRSELIINDIVHEGKPLINISIPDYIQWDYTGDENQYDIYVGSGYDQDYIDSILKINSYRPDTKDFTQIFVSGLTLIFPYIFVALLIVFIWKLLKRVFK